MNKLRPMMYYQSIFTVNYDLLLSHGIKTLIFDLDNTILGTKEDYPNKEVIDLFKKLCKSFQVFIASNNVKKRVQNVGNSLGVHGFYNVLKPSKRIQRLLSKYQVNMNEVAIIGDQIVTDIFMGNRLNMTTVLVDPITDSDLKITYFNRFLEKRIMKRIKLKKGEYYEQNL